MQLSLLKIRRNPPILNSAITKLLTVLRVTNVGNLLDPSFVPKCHFELLTLRKEPVGFGPSEVGGHVANSTQCGE